MANYAYSTLEVAVSANMTKAASDIRAGSIKAGDEAGATISSHMGKGLSKLGPVVGQIGKSIATGLGVATAAAVAWGVQAAKAAETANKVTAQTAAVIKSTGGAANVTARQIQTLANSMMAKTGIDDETIKSGQNMLLTFRNVRNEAGRNNDVFNQASKTLLDMTAALSGGNVTAEATRKQAIQLGKALNDPIKGLSALRRVGVSFTDQQTKQITTLTQSGHTLEAQKIILAELNKEFGGSAAASATASERIKTAYKEIQEAIGSTILKAIEPAMSKLGMLASRFTAMIAPGGKLAPIMSAIGVALSRTIAPLTRFVDLIGRGLAKLSPGQINQVADAIKRFGPLLAAAGAGAAIFTGAGLLKQLPVIGPLISGLVGPLKSIIPLIGGEKGLAGAFKALTGPWGIILTIFTVLMTVSPQFRNAVMELAKSLLVALMPAFNAIFAALKPLMPVIVMLAKLLGAALAPVVKALTPLLVSLTPLIAMLADLLAKLVGVVMILLGPALKLYIAFQKWYTARILIPMINLLVTALTWLVRVITSVVKWILGGSPGLVPAFLLLQRIVLSVTTTIRNAVVAGFTAIRNAIVSAWRWVTTSSQAAWGTLRSLVLSGMRALVGAVSAGMNLIKGFISRGWQAAVNIVQNIAGALRSAGVSAIRALLGGITAAMAGIGGWVKGHIVDPVVNAVKSFFGIHSPSAVMEGLGKNVTAGFVQGLVQQNPLTIARHIFGGIPNALAGLVSKGLVSIGQLPGKAMTALGKVGGWAMTALTKVGGLFGRLFGGGGGTGQYAGIMHAVLSHFGIPGLFGTFMQQMMTESGGNRFAVNRTDSNWVAGTPSVGLMQVIGPTFAAYAGPYRNRGPFMYGVSTDPLANIYAAVAYALSRYGGSIAYVLGHGHGYAQGGMINEPITGFGHRSGSAYFFGERGPEMVSPLTGPGASPGQARPVVVNVYPQRGQSEVEIAAAVSRRLAWAAATGRA